MKPVSSLWRYVRGRMKVLSAEQPEPDPISIVEFS